LGGGERETFSWYWCGGLRWAKAEKDREGERETFIMRREREKDVRIKV